jgi:hypothetical protein
MKFRNFIERHRPIAAVVFAVAVVGTIALCCGSCGAF